TCPNWVRLTAVGRIAWQRLALNARQSGTRTGRPSFAAARPMSGERQHPAGTLYASPRRHPFQPGREDEIRSVQDGRKSVKAAITTIMRKMIFLANALLCDGRNWAASMI